MTELEFGRDAVARGQRLVEAGEYLPDSMGDALDVIAWNRAQQEEVAVRGRCRGGCVADLLVERFWHEDLVCRNTWRSCPHMRLRDVSELWSKLFPEEK